MRERKASNPFGQRLDITELLTTPPPPLKHVLPGLLAGTVGAVVAPGGTGKTMFLLQLATAIASAGSLCGGLLAEASKACSGSTEAGKVVLVVAEESRHLMWHRIHAVAGHLLSQGNPTHDMLDCVALRDSLEANLHVHALLGQPRALLFDDDYEPTTEFDQLVQACIGAKLVLLDPLRQFHRGDENDSWNMTAAVQALQSLAALTGAAVVVAHHTNRASSNMGTGDGAGAARGSTALTDGIRWQLNLSRPNEVVSQEYGISTADKGRFVQVDIAKANYLAPQPTEVLRRASGGALTLVARPRTAGSSAPFSAAASRRRSAA